MKQIKRETNIQTPNKQTNKQTNKEANKQRNKETVKKIQTTANGMEHACLQGDLEINHD